MGKYGTATGITFIKTPAGVVALVGFEDGEFQAAFNSAGKVIAGGGRVRMEAEGLVIEYNVNTERVPFGGGSPRIPYGGDPRIPYGGNMLPVFKFRREGTDETYVLYQHSDEFTIGYSAEDGADGYPTRWRFTNTGGMKLPVLASAPGDAAVGMLAVADGVGWNPGAGAGMYEYKSSGWSKL